MKNTYSQIFKTENWLLTGCLAALSGFLLVTFFRANLHSIDLGVNLWIPTIQSSTLTFFAQGMALIFGTISLAIISLAISGILFLKKYKAHSLLLLGAMGGDALIVSTLKILEHVSRPTNGIFLDTGFSYPSGHSAGCIVFGGVLAYFAWQHWQSPSSRFLIGGVLGIVVGVVGFDRVYLNVHWLSDVFGGWLFGVFWLLFVVLVFRHLNVAGKFQFDKFNLIANVLFALATVASVLIIVQGLFGFSIIY